MTDCTPSTGVKDEKSVDHFFTPDPLKFQEERHHNLLRMYSTKYDPLWVFSHRVFQSYTTSNTTY